MPDGYNPLAIKENPTQNPDYYIDFENSHLEESPIEENGHDSLYIPGKQITLFEICQHITHQGEIKPKPEASQEAHFRPHADGEILQLQLLNQAQRINFELFLQVARGEEVSHLFGKKQMAIFTANNFNPDNYSKHCPQTSADIMWRQAELFRLWAATNVNMLNSGLTPDMLAAYQQDLSVLYSQIAKDAFPSQLSDNPFLAGNPNEHKVVPLPLSNLGSMIFPSQTVRLFINETCVLVPLPTAIFSFENRILYLNEFSAFFSDSFADPRYQAQTFIKTLAYGLLMHKLGISFSKSAKINPYKEPKPAKIKTVNPNGILIGQIPALWGLYKNNIYRRHLILEQHLNPAKNINFLHHTGLTFDEIEQMNSIQISALLENAIVAASVYKHGTLAKVEKNVRERPDGSFRIIPKPKAKKSEKPSKRKPKKVFQLNLPGI